MKKQNRISITVLMICFMVFAIIPSFFIIPSSIQTTTTADNVNFQEPDLKTSQFIPRTIRVAVYNEPNITSPSYASGSTSINSNNLTDTLALLNYAGYQVTQLTTNDIYDHKLKTADFDVFIMVDNLPRENITNFVKEYWLGGGGLLSFDSGICFLCYTGILPPEAVGGHDEGTSWSYISGDHEIYQRHPISQQYSVGDPFTSVPGATSTYDWAYLQTTSIASDLVRIATKDLDANDVTVLGFDPSNGGGRVVQMPWHLGKIPSNMTDLVADTIDWLCPRPKGRILFDLSHRPIYGVDIWDSQYVQSTPRYEIWRDNLVNRSYTFDKLYPSTLGNLTNNNLASYDVLILSLPDLNFTASEISALTNWVNNGGSVIAIGEHVVFYDENLRINNLFVNFDLKMNLTDSGSGSATYQVEHPTIEGCTQITVLTAGKIVYSGNAFPIWGGDADNIYVGGQEYGNGRIILMSDVAAFRDNQIMNYDNLQYGINVINWLTASQAKVIIFVDGVPGSDPNDNLYKGPVATALNDLKIPFYLTFTGSYFNLSLGTETWKLAILENNNLGTSSYFPDILNYMKSGGMLIIRSYHMYLSPTDPLWQYLGYTPNGTRITSPPPEINIWSPTHPIFNNPVSYDANNLTTSLNPFLTDFCYVTLHNNATAIAGLGTTVNVTKGAIILSNNGRAISNTFGITEYYDDTDDSTYPDALEIWENEIAFMTYQSLSVYINNPLTGDDFDATAPSFSITTDGIIIDETYYTLNDGTHHPVSSTSGTINQGSWDALPDGTVSLKFYVEDTAGSSKYHERIIDKDTQAPIIDIISPTSGQTFNTTAPTFIVNITDDHLDKMWYTVDVGLTNFTFTTNGTLNQAAWDALSEGTITIRFYANDTLGHESFEQVSIVIDLPSTSKKIIPGYSSYLIIGVISIISVLILRKQLKRYKTKN